MYAAVQCLVSACSIRVIKAATVNDLVRVRVIRRWGEVARREGICAAQHVGTYHQPLIHKQIQQAISNTRIQTKVNNYVIPLVVPHYEDLSKLRTILHSGYKTVASSTQTQDLLSKPPKLVFKSPPLPSQQTGSSKAAAYYKCQPYYHPQRIPPAIAHAVAPVPSTNPQLLLTADSLAYIHHPMQLQLCNRKSDLSATLPTLYREFWNLELSGIGIEIENRGKFVNAHLGIIDFTVVLQKNVVPSQWSCQFPGFGLLRILPRVWLTSEYLVGFRLTEGCWEGRGESNHRESLMVCASLPGGTTMLTVKIAKIRDASCRKLMFLEWGVVILPWMSLLSVLFTIQSPKGGWFCGFTCGDMCEVGKQSYVSESGVESQLLLPFQQLCGLPMSLQGNRTRGYEGLRKQAVRHPPSLALRADNPSAASGHSRVPPKIRKSREMTRGRYSHSGLAAEGRHMPSPAVAAT
ncbi:hypothetical protein PR048_023335 [Dryococelus australis]|uniref:Uncharacterized protein n=1 Tax=Dryococelus australis TaxID=614101 RepID=A0ABQ9GTS7_9NEOP|nr:hypothetical protein PR048_023335 [Dryococelus australis]